MVGMLIPGTTWDENSTSLMLPKQLCCVKDVTSCK